MPATTMKTADRKPSESCLATSGAPRTFSPSTLARMQGVLKVSRTPSSPPVRRARPTHATPTLSLRDLLLSPCDPELRTQLVVLWRCSTPCSTTHSGGGCTQCLSSPAREDELTVDQMALHCLQCWMLPEREQKRHHGLSLFAALTLHNRVRGARIMTWTRMALLCDPHHEDPASWHDVKSGRMH